MTAIVVSIAPPADLQQVTDGAASDLEALQAIAVHTPADEEFAAKILAGIKGDMKVLDAQRTTITKPLNDAKRAVDALFKPALDYFKAAEVLLKGKIAASLEARARDNARALQAAAAADTPAEASAALAQIDASASPPGTGARWYWDYEIVDMESVPRSFLGLDYIKVNQHLDAHGRTDVDPPVVAGLRFFRKARIVSRSR